MFRPNLVGQLFNSGGRDVHSRQSWNEAVACPFAIVNLDVSSEKTTVRADSSASRGAADQRVTNRATILVVKTLRVEIGNKFEFEGIAYLVASVHKRRSVFGKVDHIECGLTVLP